MPNIFDLIWISPKCLNPLHYKLDKVILINVFSKAKQWFSTLLFRNVWKEMENDYSGVFQTSLLFSSIHTYNVYVICMVHISVTRNICSICLFQKTKSYVMYNDQAPEKTTGHKAHSKGWWPTIFIFYIFFFSWTCLSAPNRATQNLLQSILLVGSSVYLWQICLRTLDTNEIILWKSWWC